MSPIGLDGQTVLITGAASGIGRATALYAARRGAQLILCDVDEQGLEETASTASGFGASILAQPADVTDPALMQQFAAAVRTTGWPVDVLVNNAGVAVAGSFSETEMDDWAWVIATNLCGLVHTCQLFVPGMLERGSGHIVNLASLAGLRASPAQIAYSTVKAAVLHFSAALRLELQPHHIGVSAICPGIVNTPLPQHARWRGRAAAPDVRARVTARYQRDGCSPDLIAGKIFLAARRDRAVVPVTRQAWTVYWMARMSPSAAGWMAQHRGSLR